MYIINQCTEVANALVAAMLAVVENAPVAARLTVVACEYPVMSIMARRSTWSTRGLPLLPLPPRHGEATDLLIAHVDQCYSQSSSSASSCTTSLGYVHLSR